MFYTYSINNQSDWVVLTLASSLLWQFDCAFCLENAASNNVRYIPIKERKTPKSFEKMFEDLPNVDRLARNLPDRFPTHPQAEILVFQTIPPEYINGVHFYGFDGYENIDRATSFL